MGVVYEPARARLTWAARGSGCFREDAGAAQRTVVSPAERLEGTTLVMSRGSQERHARQVALFASAGAKFTYSAGIKLAMVARGEVDLYLGDYLGYSDWDLCAGDILVEEAGGRVTDRDGHLIPYAAPAGRSARGCLATNGLLHDAALSALRGAGL